MSSHRKPRRLTPKVKEGLAEIVVTGLTPKRDFRADVDSSKELEKDDKLGFRGVEDEWVSENVIY